YDVFILDIGDDKGLKKGDRVYARGDILIGEIAEVNGRTSKAKLYSSSGEKFGVLIGDKNIQATATGKGGGTFEIVLPHDTKIAVGDSVAVPDLTDSFFGNVEDVISEPTNPFSTVLFRQPINIYELKWLMVEKKI
ncbi:MAG: rod shape-determining protein MreC, partial [bacterium]|nr:rod shape-determining protein MreC [bacterium]